MKVVFLLVGTEGRPKEINGDTIRFGNSPSSGTDQSFIMIAEYLSMRGHDVTIVLDKTDGKNCRGVKYTDFNYDGLINQKVDILISALWFDKYENIPFTVTKGLIYWYHMAWVYSLNEMISFCKNYNLKMGFVNISKWARNQNDWNINIAKEQIENIVDTIIPNPIMTELIDEILSEDIIKKREKTTIFHAQYGRGGNIANKTVKELGWEPMHCFDYINPSNGIDKKTLFRKLLETDYFIFPLYHPNGCVYKDTFSCSVAEAIATGVIVLTYPLGALPEYFNDGCVFLDFPNGTNIEKMMTEKVTCNAEYMDYHINFVNKIIEIENNPHYKIQIREKSKNTIKNRFNINIVGDMWVNLIKQFND